MKAKIAITLAVSAGALMMCSSAKADSYSDTFSGSSVDSSIWESASAINAGGGGSPPIGARVSGGELQLIGDNGGAAAGSVEVRTIASRRNQSQTADIIVTAASADPAHSYIGLGGGLLQLAPLNGPPNPGVYFRTDQIANFWSVQALDASGNNVLLNAGNLVNTGISTGGGNTVDYRMHFEQTASSVRAAIDVDNDGTYDYDTGALAGDFTGALPAYLGERNGNFLIDSVTVTAPPVPEPASLGLLSCGALAMLRRRRSGC